MPTKEHKSAFRALVHGMSWEGRTVVRKYRDGGRRVEEVLTAEVFQALQFLPSEPFIRKLFSSIHSLNEDKSFLLEPEHEGAEFLMSPAGRFALRPGEPTHQTQIDVQFDAMIRTHSSAIFVEAKRIGKSSFQFEQPARTYLIAQREANPYTPKVLFVLGEAPPVSVAKRGKLSVEDAVTQPLEDVFAKTQHLNLTLDMARERIRDCVGWITWSEIAEAVASAQNEFECSDPNIDRAVSRIANFILESINWHS